MPFPSGTHLGELAGRIRDEFDNLYSLLEGWLRREHKENGSHGAVTADSVAVSGALTVTGTINTFTITTTVTSGPGPDGPGIVIPAGSSGDSWSIVTSNDGTDPGLFFANETAAELPFVMYRVSSGVYSFGPQATAGATLQVDLGQGVNNNFRWDTAYVRTLDASTGVTTAGALAIADGITAPDALTGYAKIYVDTADGDLKVKFGDGTVKTLATDTP